MKVLITFIIILMTITGCTDYGRYEIARNHLTGEDCYVLDWKDGEHLSATPANIKLAEGDFFWADPEQCHK